MRTIPLADSHSIQVYESALEMSARRYSELQHYFVQESGIGADVNGANGHFDRLHQLLAAGNTAEAADEAALLHYSFNFIAARHAPLQLAFACLVGMVDGESVADLSERGLTELVAKLSGWGLTQGQVAETVSEVKKKSLVNSANYSSS